MTTFPVHYRADKPVVYSRAQLGARVVAIIALGLLGVSLGALYLVAYLVLPAFAAVRLAGGRDPSTYLAEDGPRLLRGLRWFAAVYGWFALVAEAFPMRASDVTVHVDIEPTGRPTPGSALARLLFGIPSALFLLVLGWVAGVVWIWAALVVLFRHRVSDWAFAYLAGVQRWSIRLLAYQASLVASYPPFSLEDAGELASGDRHAPV